MLIAMFHHLGDGGIRLFWEEMPVSLSKKQLTLMAAWVLRFRAAGGHGTLLPSSVCLRSQVCGAIRVRSMVVGSGQI